MEGDGGGGRRGEVHPSCRATAEIVRSYSTNPGNAVTAADLPQIAREVAAAMRDGTAEPPAAAPPAGGAAAGDGFVTCLEDGLRLASLTLHLRVAHQLTPAQYRRRWGLPADHPMEPASRTAERRAAARETGLGRHDRRRGGPR